MTTEGTYPFVVGGVSTWCKQLIGGLPEMHWQILPITSASERRKPIFSLPPNAELVGRLDLWSDRAPGWRPRSPRAGADRVSLPAELLRELLGWHGDVYNLVDALVWCRNRATRLPTIFRRREAWELFLEAVQEVVAERRPAVGEVPQFDLYHAGQLYQALYWIAQVAAAPTPSTDLLLVTAAGWAAIPALVHQALHRTPLLLSEHGVYVREAYLAAARADEAAPSRFISTRLARGLARAAYAKADAVAPVSDANARWEEALGVPRGNIRVIRNGIRSLSEPAPFPGTNTVVCVGRLDPLKDIHTLLKVAAEVIRQVPDARFLHYGPVPPGQQGYARSCRELHAHLELGERFQFRGSTTDPVGVIRDADLAIMTSISEGFPISLLEAMSQGRPVVATSVGGVTEAVRGCGFLAASGDVHELAAGVVTLLHQPELAAVLGRRGLSRATTEFTESACLDGYRHLLNHLTSQAAAS